MNKVGITTTIPVEVIYAADLVPVDLNNLFITAGDPGGMVNQAESGSLPRSVCSWVKGIYSAIKNNSIKTVVAVTEGDCAHTLAALDLLSERGVRIIPFAYPYNRDPDEMEKAISKLEKKFGVTRNATLRKKQLLDRVREKALLIDRMTWKENVFSGFENHLALISCSDFEGDPEKFERKLEKMLREASDRSPRLSKYRLGYCGVPTIFSDLYQFLKEKGARVVYNEMQRQFAMPSRKSSIVDQYLDYTYPYSYRYRIEDIKKQVSIRQIDGIIHYVQSFCHHQIHDRSLRQAVNCPVLTLEGDKPGPLRERSKIRIESFLEMLRL